jgi:hypothetical protein
VGSYQSIDPYRFYKKNLSLKNFYLKIYLGSLVLGKDKPLENKRGSEYMLLVKNPMHFLIT